MDTEKVVYYKRTDKSYCQIQYINFLCSPKPSFWGVQIQNYYTGKQLCGVTLFKRNWSESLCFPEG